MKFEIGDKVRIVGRTHTHFAPIGAVGEVDDVGQVDGLDDADEAVGVKFDPPVENLIADKRDYRTDETLRYQWLVPSDLELVEDDDGLTIHERAALRDRVTVIIAEEMDTALRPGPEAGPTALQVAQRAADRIVSEAL